MKLILTSFLFLLLGTPSYSVERVQVFPYSYNEVWRGLLIALSRYPLKKNNQQTGDIETELINGGQIWNPPYKEINPNLRYKIILKLYDGKSGKRNATKVSVYKEGYIKNDFVGDPKPIESDGLEETALIYRASREIIINKLADKKFRSKN